MYAMTQRSNNVAAFASKASLSSLSVLRLKPKSPVTTVSSLGIEPRAYGLKGLCRSCQATKTKEQISDAKTLRSNSVATSASAWFCS